MSRGNSIAASGFTLAVVATIFFLALPSMSCGENNVVDKAVTAYLKLYSKLTGSENKETEKVVAVGSKISLNYRGTLADGTVFDSSAGRGPFEFEAGRGEVIPGFDQAVIGMKLNEKKAFTIPAAEAYGEKQESLLRKVPHSFFPENSMPKQGDRITLGDGSGRQYPATISEIGADSVTLDMNHPLAGQDLTFEIEIIGIESSAVDSIGTN